MRTPLYIYTKANTNEMDTLSCTLHTTVDLPPLQPRVLRDSVLQEFSFGRVDTYMEWYCVAPQLGKTSLLRGVDFMSGSGYPLSPMKPCAARHGALQVDWHSEGPQNP